MDFEFFHEKRRFLKNVALLFQEVIDEYRKGNSINVSISMPPRAGKSYITSLFSAFWLSQFPELSVMRNTCTERLFQKFSYDTRAIIRSDKFKEIFSNIELAQDKQNLNGWNLTTSKQVGYFGAGVGGTIIGFGANIAITDDIYKSMQDALSANTDENVKMWKQSAHDSRKEKNCPEIFIGTRWTKNDVIGEAVDSNKINKSVIIPALIDNESFCEDVKSTSEYLKIKSEIDNMVWLAEYMQDPTNPEGLLIPFDKLKWIDKSLITDQHIVYRFSVIDPANTGGDKFSQPFIYVIFTETMFAAYIADVLHNTDGIEINCERIPQKVIDHNIENLPVESNGLGLAAVILLKKILPEFCKLMPFTSSVNKDARVLSNFEFILRYFYFDKEKYETNKEYNQFVKDLTSFTKEGDNKHKKDAIDVCASAAHILKIKYHNILFSK